jgi:hypothetical protein
MDAIFVLSLLALCVLTCWLVPLFARLADSGRGEEQ